MATNEEIRSAQQQWLETVASGRDVAAHAETAIQGCRAAILQLEAGYRALDYPVRNFLHPLPAGYEAGIAALEAHTGIPVPEVVRVFWRVVGGASFVDVEQYRHDAYWSERGIAGRDGYCDGFHVDGLEESWLEYTRDNFDVHREDDVEDLFRYELSPDGYHKDDISGGDAYAVGQNDLWAPTWENFEWSGYRRPETAAPDPTDFLSYVRTALLECAGFPGLLGHPQFEPLRLHLTANLPVF